MEARTDCSLATISSLCFSTASRTNHYPTGKTQRMPSSLFPKKIPLYRNSDLSYVSPIPAHLEGRSCVVTFREPGLRWTRQRRAREAWAGRIALREPKTSCWMSGAARFVSPVSLRLRRQGWKNCGEMAGRAYGKTVWSWPSLLRSSSCGCGIHVNRRGAGDFRESEGGQQELGSRESTA
jgi:hypothetical protein